MFVFFRSGGRKVLLSHLLDHFGHELRRLLTSEGLKAEVGRDVEWQFLVDGRHRGGHAKHEQERQGDRVLSEWG